MSTKNLESAYQPGTSIAFLLERNPDNTLNVFFSDNMCFDFFDEEYIDDVVFDYKPDLKKIQAFSEEELHTLSAQDDQCH